MARLDPILNPADLERVIHEQASAHPLEMFPWFRRWAPGIWRDLVYTLIWNTGFMAIFVVVGLVATLRLPSPLAVWAAFVIAQCVGFTLHGLFHLGGCTVEAAIRRRGRVAITAYYMVVSTVGVITGFWIGTALLGRETMPPLTDVRWVLSIAVTSLAISLVLAIIFFWRERSALAEAALERAQRRTNDIEREALVANLRALQAQVEPHFLFNTLANVTSLIDADPARAKSMLEAFIRFLRASLAATRRSETTLADEFALIADFLAVLRVRMGDRLAVRIDVPPELDSARIPPMLVQPLVENAIRHGLEPKIEGGAIEIRVRRDGARLRIEIADTGVGFGDETSGGLGLANVRERLRLAHGDAGRLAIRANAPHGTIVTLELPLAA